MDIDLGADAKNGIELARKINGLRPQTQIIYVSQYIEYVSSVYETEHIYFINKSQAEEYLGRALEKAMQKLTVIGQEYLYLQNRQAKYSIPQNDILYMERTLRTTEIHTSEKIHFTSEPLQRLLERLSPCFVICHRSFLVNLKVVKQMSRREILLWNETSLPVGRTYYDEVKRRFSHFISGIETQL